MTNTTWEERFDEKFPCLDKNCDNNGCITGYDREGEPEQQQCQYCFENRIPFKSFIAQELSALKAEVKSLISNEIKDEKLLEVIMGKINDL